LQLCLTPLLTAASLLLSVIFMSVVKKAILVRITYSEFVPVALVTQHAMLIRHIAIYGLPRSTSFFRIISQTVRISVTHSLNIKYVI
jgi:hypothetical protein